MVTITSKNEKNRYEWEIKGHAGFKSGNDIVCAAVSAITYTLVQMLLNMQERNAFGELDYLLEDGYASVKATVRPTHMQEMNTVTETILGGYMLLESKYPDHVTMDFGVGEAKKKK
ncbi:ribosomal-processing cysteine protease Prp [Lachnospiraceae bacterium AM48-27BH]|nr:ribosomal-processing cysteine protease Prp [Lachnospiraceae bacterium AM48-27BH]